VINLSIPYLAGNEKKYLEKCIKKNYVSTVGNFIIRFENKFKSLLKFRYNLALNSGTSALHLALLSIGIKKNELVITQSYTFAATANAILYCNAEPWFFDVKKEDMSLDIEQLEKELSQNTFIKDNKCIHKKTKKTVKAIVPVFSLGISPNLKTLNSIAKKYKLKVIYDAAAAHATKYQNKNLSSQKITACFSFNGNKSFTAGGGGILATNEKKIYEKAKILANIGKSNTKYNYEYLGYNYKMTNLQAAVGLGQLQNFKKIINNKKKIFNYYQENILNNDTLKKYIPPEWHGGTQWIFFCTIKTKISEKLVAFFKKKNIQISFFWKPLHLQKPYRNYLRTNMSFSNYIWNRLLTLPSSAGLSKKDQKKIIKTTKSFFKIK